MFTYDGPMRPFLLALRSQTIPPALMPFLYDIQPPISFVDGCIVVEIHDLRRNPESRTRVVMRPAPLAISQTIDQMLDRNGVSTEDEHLALGIESRILVRVSVVSLPESLLPLEPVASTTHSFSLHLPQLLCYHTRAFTDPSLAPLPHSILEPRSWQPVTPS